MKNLFKVITLAGLLAVASMSCKVIYKKDQGKHKGWFKNKNNPNNPNTTNPKGKKGKSNAKKKNKNQPLLLQLE